MYLFVILINYMHISYFSVHIYIWKINKTSIIMDATKYIEELKQKVERLVNQDMATTAQTEIDHQNPLPMVL